jgi:AcrR family transcriptional regulator
MKTTTLPSVADSRARIHAAALRLFARHGFDGVSLQLIADEVGLHKSSLFHHYRGKLDLAREVIEGAIEKLIEKLAPLAQGGAPKLETLLEVVDVLVDHFADEPDAARLFMMALTMPPESSFQIPVSEEPNHPLVKTYTIIWQWLERAKRTGAIRAVNLPQTILNLIGIVLFYPAVAPMQAAVAGPEPFSAKARAVRKKELRFALKGMLAVGPSEEL